MKKFNHGFSMKRAVVILAVFLVVVTLFPIVWGEKNSKDIYLSESSDCFFDKIYRSYEQSNSAYAWTDWMHEPIYWI